MDWTAQIDGYCERLGPGLLAEPVNLLTNAAFLIAAAVMWRRTGPARDALAVALITVLAAIGIGSALFHSLATRWAALADVLPILIFILIYLYASNRDFLRLGRGWSLALTAAFLPYAAALAPLFGMIPGLGGSASYAPVALLILIYAAILWRRAPATARGLSLGAGLLILSLGFRTLDAPICMALPLGTHFLWHILNGIMLGWMIEVRRRHIAGR